MWVYVQESLAGDTQSTHLLSYSFVVLLKQRERIWNEGYNTNYSYKLFNNLQSTPLGCLWFVASGGEGSTYHYHPQTCQSVPPCAKLLLKCHLCLQIVSHMMSDSHWESDCRHVDWGQNRTGTVKLPILNNGDCSWHCLLSGLQHYHVRWQHFQPFLDTSP